MYIDTEKVSAKYRTLAIDLEKHELLLTRFTGTNQEKDLTVPPNCEGYGRIRHFRRLTSDGWPSNPLPIEPACGKLRITSADELKAQVFQNAVCNWRCWYCFVPFDLLSANSKYSGWLSASKMIDLYLDQDDPPKVIDLTGGQPDLVPEWVPWIMEELKRRKLENTTYLWSDDNLSNDYFWRYLSDKEIELVATFHNYGRVCCFKGFDIESFSFNTCADPSLFDRQFDLMRRLLALGIDLYGYVTLTSPTDKDLDSKISRFVDRLQSLNENLPLRTVPLEVSIFTPVVDRLNESKRNSMLVQKRAIECWNREIDTRFSEDLKSLRINEVSVF